MKPQKILPEGYRQSVYIHLQQDKKLALIVNALSIGIALLMFLPGTMAVPFSQLFSGSPVAAFFLLPGSVLYLVLHELIHGIFMRGFSGVRPHYGFTGLYAYAGSEVYFDRTRYLIIALAPVVIWGILLAVLCAFTTGAWFWLFYFIQILNISGAAGDFYVTWRFSRLPRDILIQDTGIAMTVYTKD